MGSAMCHHLKNEIFNVSCPNWRAYWGVNLSLIYSVSEKILQTGKGECSTIIIMVIELLWCHTDLSYISDRSWQLGPTMTRGTPGAAQSLLQCIRPKVLVNILKSIQGLANKIYEMCVELRGLKLSTVRDNMNWKRTHWWVFFYFPINGLSCTYNLKISRTGVISLNWLWYHRYVCRHQLWAKCITPHSLSTSEVHQGVIKCKKSEFEENDN